METKVIVDTMWVLITAMLVFFMNLGFAAVESGFARAKNCVNIMSKNFVVFAASSLGFLIIGWGLMFGDGTPFIGLKGLFFAGGVDNSPAVGEAYKGVYSAFSSWSSAAPPPLSYPGRWPNGSSTSRSLFSRSPWRC
jgi:ammonium transporter, Amt family